MTADQNSNVELRGPGPKTPNRNVELLGPGPEVDSGIEAFGSGYQQAKDAFDSLLQYPFLEAIKYTTTEDHTTKGGKSNGNKQNLRELLLEGQTCFRVSTERDRKAAVDLVSYGQIVGSMLTDRSLSNFVTVIGPIAAHMAETARDNSTMKSIEYKQLKSFIDALNSTIDSTTTSLATVTAQLSNATTDLSKLDVRETVTKLLGAIFEFAHAPEDFNTQLGVLLGLAAEAVSSALKQLTTDKAPLLELVARLKKLSTQLREISRHLVQLSKALPDMIAADLALSSVFDGVQENLTILADSDVTLTEKELTAVVEMWGQNGEKVMEMVDIMNGVAVAKPKSLPAPAWHPAYPMKPAALQMHQLANATGSNKFLVSREHFQVASRLAADESVINHLVSKAFASFGQEGPLKMPSTDSNESSTTEDMTIEDLAAKFSPPHDMIASLDNLKNNCKSLKQKFDGLLVVPGMEYLLVDNPFLIEDQQALLNAEIKDTTPSKVAKLNVREMIIRFKALYETMENESRELMQALHTYACTQLALLPTLTMVAEGDRMSLAGFVAIHTPQVQGLKTATLALQLRHATFKNKWHDAGINVEKLINEERENMASYETQINNLEKEQSDAHYTFFGALKLIGGLAFFGLAVILTPISCLHTLALGVSSSLIGWGISDLIKENKLNQALGELRDMLGKVKEKIGVLAPVLVVMHGMETTLGTLLSKFSDIYLNLNNVSKMIISAGTIDMVRGPVMVNWNKMKDSTDAYLAIIDA